MHWPTIQNLIRTCTLHPRVLAWSNSVFFSWCWLYWFWKLLIQFQKQCWVFCGVQLVLLILRKLSHFHCFFENGFFSCIRAMILDNVKSCDCILSGKIGNQCILTHCPQIWDLVLVCCKQEGCCVVQQIIGTDFSCVEEAHKDPQLITCHLRNLYDFGARIHEQQCFKIFWPDHLHFPKPSFAYILQTFSFPDIHYTCPSNICTLQHHCSVFVCNYNQHHILQLLKHSSTLHGMESDRHYSWSKSNQSRQYITMLLLHRQAIRLEHKQLSFHFLCVLWGISPRRRILGHYARGRSSNPYMFPHSHKKRVIYVHGGSCTCGFSSGSGTPFGSRPQVALRQVNPLIQEPPLQLTEPSFASSFLLFLAQRAHLPPEARTRPEPRYLRAVYSV